MSVSWPISHMDTTRKNKNILRALLEDLHSHFVFLKNARDSVPGPPVPYIFNNAVDFESNFKIPNIIPTPYMYMYMYMYICMNIYKSIPMQI